MKRNNSIIIKWSVFILIMTMVTTSFSQSILEIENKMAKFQFDESILLLKKIISKENKYSLEAKVKLAECYRLKNQPDSAAKYYHQYILEDTSHHEARFYFASMLRTMGEYDSAAKQFIMYDSLIGEDNLRALKFAEYCRQIEKYQKKYKKYKIRNLSVINSPYSDFSPIIYKEHLVFTSDRPTGQRKDKTYGWTGNSYLNIYSLYIDLDSDKYDILEDTLSIFNDILKSDFHDGTPSFSSDGNIVWFTRTIKDKTNKDLFPVPTHVLKIFKSELVNGKWTEPEAFFLNSNEYSVGHPCLSNDGKKLYFASNMPGGFGGTDIYVCEEKSGEWSDPINLGHRINTMDDEMFPQLFKDHKLYFSSNGRLGFGGLDIYYSEFKNNEWSETKLMEENINSSYDDFSISFIDESNGFISSNRPGGIGGDDIYAFQQKPPITISGIVISDSGLFLNHATVFVLNHTTNEVLALKTDSTGKYSTLVDPYTIYTVLGKKQSFLDDCLEIEIQEESISLTDLILPQMLNKIYTVENIYYDLDKWFIRPDAEIPLNEVVTFLLENPVKIELSSHTDCRASHPYNEKLSQRRAEAAVEYIVNQGVDSTRIVAKGYGETMLVNECEDGVDCTEEQHQLNRRTEFKIIEIVNDSNNIDILEKYKHGEYYQLDEFDEDFFKKCLEILKTDGE